MFATVRAAAPRSRSPPSALGRVFAVGSAAGAAGVAGVGCAARGGRRRQPGGRRCARCEAAPATRVRAAWRGAVSAALGSK